jgi:plasmid rolling circle replication initiator protein Rep
MADAFVEREWEPERKVGNLFTIHLENTKWLSTRSIEFTLDDKVKEELKKIIGTNLIEKDRNYTLDEFFPRIKPLVEELVADGEEILVSTDGKVKGFKKIGENEFETWRGGRKKSKMITMRKKDYLREHHHLFKVLSHPTKKKLLKELMAQQKELKERGLKGGTRRQSPRRSRST